MATPPAAAAPMSICSGRLKLYWANQWGVTTNSNYAGEISGTSYAHQGVTGGQFYIYRVLSVGPPGESELSWEAYVYVP